jgi:hypothetical protein
MALEMVQRGENNASVGFDWHGARKITRGIDGQQVECVVDATLDEISFLSSAIAPAIRQSFVAYGDVDYSNSLRDDCLAGRLVWEGKALAFKRALNDLLHAA